MKALVTGLNGTLAPVLAGQLKAAGHTVSGWDRAVIPTNDFETTRRHIRNDRPDAFFHLATGSADWAEQAARACAELSIPFLFTSSVSVYPGEQQGPFEVTDLPRPNDDYGRYKLDCETRVRAAHPQAHIVRIGWQIGNSRGGNHMLDYLLRQHAQAGRIEASINWFQACSFLPDTAQGLIDTLLSLPGGLYHLDGNPGLNFFQIVHGLNRLHGHNWEIMETIQPALDNRLLDARVNIRKITASFL
jgi:dTDP-4-dehydrorhamnose reductase